MSQTNSSSRLAPWQAMTMLAVGIAIIFFGLMALKVNARIVLAVDGAIMCLMASVFLMTAFKKASKIPSLRCLLQC